MEQIREKPRSKSEREKDKRSKNNSSVSSSSAELSLDVSQLPQDIRDKLAELELELSEGKKQNIIEIFTSFMHILDKQAKPIHICFDFIVPL